MATKVNINLLVDALTSAGTEGATGKVTVVAFHKGKPEVRISGDDIVFPATNEVTFKEGVASGDIYITHLANDAYWKFSFEVGSVKQHFYRNLPNNHVGASIDFGSLQTVNPTGA